VSAKRPAVGDAVVISIPDNHRADGQPATVEAVAEWGAHLKTGFGSGEFRATWEEMTPPRKPAVRTTGPVAKGVRSAFPATVGGKMPARNGVAKSVAKAQGFTGDPCGKCQGGRMVRNGACLLCVDCGESSGCS
jgi:hypothetical protein